MRGAEPPGPDPEPEPDQEPDPGLDGFRAALERNPLARWWRDRAGTTGETGSRLIARDVPLKPRDPERPSGTTN